MRTKEMQKEEVLSIKPECVKKNVEYMDCIEFKTRIATLPAKTLDLPKDTIVEVFSNDFGMKFSSRVYDSRISYIIDYQQGDDCLMIYVDRSVYKFSGEEMISLYTIVREENTLRRVNVVL